MYIQLFFAVFISAVAFAASESNGDGLSIVAIAKANFRAVGSRSKLIEERTKRAASASDRDTILNTFNCQRSLVGASDMNYLSWSSTLEDDANTFLQGCDFDASFQTSTMNSYILKNFNQEEIGYTSSVKSYFYTAVLVNWVTSKYMLQVSGGYRYCATFRSNGQTYSGVHFYGFGISATSSFNSAIKQYTSGNACTRCQPGVSWCYSKLCRDGCSNATTGCCSITDNIPDQCSSYSIPCNSSSRIEISSYIAMLLALVSALYSYLQ